MFSPLKEIGILFKSILLNVWRHQLLQTSFIVLSLSMGEQVEAELDVEDEFGHGDADEDPGLSAQPLARLVSNEPVVLPGTGLEIAYKLLKLDNSRVPHFKAEPIKGSSGAGLYLVTYRYLCLLSRSGVAQSVECLSKRSRVMVQLY